MLVLLLEDDEATRHVFKACIEDAGHSVIECSTIDDATTALRTSKIELLVIDLIIEDTNSLSLAQYAGYAAADAEIILITGSGRFTQGEVLSNYPGVTWFLRKPMPISDLEAFVHHADQRRLNDLAKAIPLSDSPRDGFGARFDA